MKRSLLFSLVTLAIASAVALIQWSALLTHINHDIWDVSPVSSSKFLDETILPRLASQPCIGGRIHLDSFFRIETRGGEDVEVSGIRTRIFVTAHNWSDVLFRDADGRECAFRLSRSPGMPSGFLIWEDGEVISRLEMQAMPWTAGEDAIAPDDRLRLMIWSYNRPRGSFDALVDRAQGKWFDIEIAVTDTGVEAIVDGQSIAAWPEIAEMRGPIGVAAGDLPVIHIDSIEADAAGDPILREDFGRASGALKRGLTLGFVQLVFWFGLLLNLILVRRWIFPKADPAEFAMAFARGLWPVAVVPLIGWWFGTIETKWDLAWWWILANVIVGLLWIIALIGQREHFRWRVEPRDQLTAEGGFSVTLLALVVILPIAVAALISMVSNPQGESFTDTLIDSPLILGPGSHFASERIADRADATLIADLRLLEPGTEVELYFLEEEHDRISPLDGIRDWVGLRLSDDPAACGLQISDQPPRSVDLDPIPLGQSISISLADRGGHITALLGQGEDASLWDSLAGGFSFGRAGIVVRGGRVEVSQLTHSGTEHIPSSSASSAWWLVVMLSLVPLLWYLTAVLLARIGGVAPSPFLRVGGIAWGGGVLLGGLIVVVLLKRPHLLSAGWAPMFAVWLPLALVIAVHHVFWLMSFDRLRHRQIISLLLFLCLVFSTERALRATPLTYSLRGTSSTGVVRNQVAMGAQEALHLWMIFTGEYRFPHRVFDLPDWDKACPFEKPEGEYRIFALGGSSTWGAGVASAELTYPRMLQDALHARGHTEVEVYNAAYLGYTTFNDLLTLRSDLLRLDPDAITLYVSANDGYLSWWTGGTQEEQWERANAMTGEGIGERMGVWLMQQRLFVALNRLLGSFESFEDILHIRVPLDRFESHLRDIVSLCRAQGIEVVFAHEVMVGDLHLAHPTHEAYHEVLDLVGEELGVPVVDPRPVFRENLVNHWMVDTVHPSADGNREIARELADALEPLIR